jgi:pyroglutamyl-peptidase
MIREARVERRLPRILVTGFEPFPGASINPTEALVERLRANPPRIDGVFRAEVLPVDYMKVGARLVEIGCDFSPDIAIHFGLALECRGFRLERVARNRFAADRPDNAGVLKAEGPICKAPDLLPSNLPLNAIHDALATRGLPVEWSDDAGGYLCNMVFTLSRAHACEGFTPAMSGFIHVPPVSTIGPGHLDMVGARPPVMPMDDLLTGAIAIAEACCAAWKEVRR